MSLSFPLSVKSRNVVFFYSGRERGCYCCAFCSLPEKGTSDHIAHRPIIQVLTVPNTTSTRVLIMMNHFLKITVIAYYLSLGESAKI